MSRPISAAGTHDRRLLELAPVLARVWAETLAAARRPPLTDNVDPERFPDGMPVLTPAQSTERREHLAEHGADWQWLNDRLDPGSRQLLFERLVFYVLGHAHARIGPSPDHLRELLRTADERLVTARDVTPLRLCGQSEQPPARPAPARVSDHAGELHARRAGHFQLGHPGPTHAGPGPSSGFAIDAGDASVRPPCGWPTPWAPPDAWSRLSSTPRISRCCARTSRAIRRWRRGSPGRGRRSGGAAAAAFRLP